MGGCKECEDTPCTCVQRGWDVYLGDECVDTVFYSEAMDEKEVVRSLIEHDSYDPSIVVRPADDSLEATAYEIRDAIWKTGVEPTPDGIERGRNALATLKGGKPDTCIICARQLTESALRMETGEWVTVDELMDELRGDRTPPETTEAEILDDGRIRVSYPNGIKSYLGRSAAKPLLDALARQTTP